MVLASAPACILTRLFVNHRINLPVADRDVST